MIKKSFNFSLSRYFFDILNMSQGIYIFLIFVLRKNVKKALLESPLGPTMKRLESTSEEISRRLGCSKSRDKANGEDLEMSSRVQSHETEHMRLSESLSKGSSARAGYQQVNLNPSKF